MAISTWAIEVKDKNSLNKMIDMVQKQMIEEIFLCQITENGAVMDELNKEDVIAIVSIKGETLKGAIAKLGSHVILDALEDDKFEIDEDGAALKGVKYPESEEDELAMLESLSS
jgi:hypothetical protein